MHLMAMGYVNFAHCLLYYCQGMDNFIWQKYLIRDLVAQPVECLLCMQNVVITFFYMVLSSKTIELGLVKLMLA